MRWIMRRDTHTDCYGWPHHTWYGINGDGISPCSVERNYNPHGWKGARAGTSQGKTYRAYHVHRFVGEAKRLRDAKAMCEKAVANWG